MADKTPDKQWNEEQWGQEVEAESQIVLEAEGEGFIATFLGMDPANANGIIQAHLEKVSDLNEQWLGDAMFINAGRDLERKLRAIPNGSQIRVQWKSSMNTGQKSPMRVFSVQWR